MKNDDQTAKLAEVLRILAGAVEQLQAVLSGGNHASKEFVSGSTEGLLTEEQVRDALKLPHVNAVRWLRRTRKIPYVRLSHRCIRYDLKKVLTAMEKFEVKTAALR